MPLSSTASLFGDDPSRRVELAQTLEERQSTELVIALVGPIGSGVTTTGEMLSDILRSRYGYQVPGIIKLSKIIRTEAFRVGGQPAGRERLAVYIDDMQTIGNRLREKFGPRYLAEKAIEQITRQRQSVGGYRDSDGRRLVQPVRAAYIIDSIKNIEEYQLLRQVYGQSLLLFGVFAPDELRRERLVTNGTDDKAVDRIFQRDEGEDQTFGQKTRDTFGEADFFICNDTRRSTLHDKLERYLHILFGTGIHTPTYAETAMFEAEAAALNSACLSRQVGAALISDKGELIGIGWNDVPRAGGGLYREDHSHSLDPATGKIEDHDFRCFKWQGGHCQNERRRRRIIDEILLESKHKGLLTSPAQENRLRAILVKSGVNAVIEYSRSIHAEMEAILSVAREGKHSLVGARLFTTVYPCHNCARHIVAAGISEVVYIQPYRKSLAIELHGDAISETGSSGAGGREKVVFRQYDGVAPQNFQRLFKPVGPRKHNAVYTRPNPATALPLFRIPLDGFADYEDKIIADLEQKERAPL